MKQQNIKRRDLLMSTALSTLTVLATSSLAQAAEECLAKDTPVQPEGPFYPVADQIDKDSDLVTVNGSKTLAAGEIIFVDGFVLNQHCEAVSGALVEIWQACETGKYNHPSDPNTAAIDPHFQYWGQAITDAQGYYKFRTIIPGAYPAGGDWIRPPHIHFKVSKLGYLELITQMYFAGQVYNQTDKILQQLSESQQKNVIVELKEQKSEIYRIGTFNIAIEKL